MPLIDFNQASKNKATQQTFNCPKSTIEAPEKLVKYVSKLIIKTLERCH